MIPDIAMVQAYIKELSREKELAPLVQKTLEFGIKILDADKGNIQRYDEKENALKIVAHKGFDPQFLEHFRVVMPGVACCGMSLKRRKRVIVEDVRHNEEFAHLRPAFAAYGFRAVQSTPIFSRNKVIAILSTHFVEPRELSVKELSLLDVFISRATPLIEAAIDNRQES